VCTDMGILQDIIPSLSANGGGGGDLQALADSLVQACTFSLSLSPSMTFHPADGEVFLANVARAIPSN
jgi:hypothetical protein